MVTPESPQTGNPQTGNPVRLPVHILLVEDNPGDVVLTTEAFERAGVNAIIDVVDDGEEAMAFLKHAGKYIGAARPYLILLDLNLPRKDGREVLQDIKADADLSLIPVIILTTSRDEADIAHSYSLHANSYITKPVNIQDFNDCVKSLGDFWIRFVTVPIRTTPPPD